MTKQLALDNLEKMLRHMIVYLPEEWYDEPWWADARPSVEYLVELNNRPKKKMKKKESKLPRKKSTRRNSTS